LSSLLVLASSALLVIGLGGTASASALPVNGSCYAYTEPPHLVVGSSGLYATGTYSCNTPSTGMKVTVCIEEQYALDAPWWSRGCTTVSDLYELRSSVQATHRASVPVYATYLRATVTGTNSRGETVTFATPPVFWFNCACYIG
jgi:hypothetical protein